MGLENPLHIALLLMVLLLVFGAKRLPEMGKGLGDGLRSFKDAVSGQTPPTGIESAPAQPLTGQPTPAAAVAVEPTPAVTPAVQPAAVPPAVFQAPVEPVRTPEAPREVPL